MADMQEGPLADAKCEWRTSAKKSEDAQIAERVRVQELLRYFQPYDAPTWEFGKARVATDPTLTAFAQLCALRLDCERSFISLIDDSKQYIVAEATRTISLKSEDIHDTDNDAIYLGQTIIDCNWGVCPGTMPCFTSTDGSLDVETPLIKANRNYYVMNDMSMLEEYKTRPYIAGWPYMKYYAEVPIHSPSGLTIGTLCVVDNKPKEGLDLKGLAILEEISHAVMDHLELCVARIQRNNAERMIQALGQFVEGNDSVRDWWIEAHKSRRAEPGSMHLSIESRADIELGSKQSDTPIRASAVNQEDISKVTSMHQNMTTATSNSIQAGLEARDKSPPILSRSNSAISGLDFTSEAGLGISRSFISPPTSVISTGPAKPSLEKSSSWLSRPSIGNRHQSQEPSDVEGMLSRAANLIREGIGLDGIAFFDPRSSDGQLLSDFNLSGEQVAWSDRRDSNLPRRLGSPSSSRQYGKPQNSDQEKCCKILAASTRKCPQLNSLLADMIRLPETTLQCLLHFFPGGGVLNYDKDGLIGGSDSIFLDSNSRPQATQSHDKAIWETIGLQRVLPGVTSVLLFPLWDMNRDKWFSYGMAWTTDLSRIFQRQDFAYLGSFGNSIMAQLSRLETVAADHAKARFISSISHELRSPLHGIMASVELLRGTGSASVTNEIVNTVESCGSTLLDTIENLLTFAKVNQITAPRTVDQAQLLGTDQNQSAMIDLAVLVEDMVQICIAGHHFHQTVGTTNISSHPQIGFDVPNKTESARPTVICDISTESNWLFQTDAAVWKRILMNILGNSLKYTSSGFIHVKLRMDEHPIASTNAISRRQELHPHFSVSPHIELSLRPVPEREPLNIILGASTNEAKYMSPPSEMPGVGTDPLRPDGSPKFFNVVLSVEDTGKGISQDYLTHHLFKPFSQENSLNPGTGLGLSIVSQLVSSLGGTVSVTSELGSGTDVNVCAAVEAGKSSTTTQTSSSKPPQFHGIRLGFYRLHVHPDLDQAPNGILDAAAKCTLAIRSTLANYATALGLSVVTVDSITSIGADIILTTEANYRECQSASNELAGPPLIVLSSDLVPHYGILSEKIEPVVMLSQPFGPRKFQEALEVALSRNVPVSDLSAAKINRTIDEASASNTPSGITSPNVLSPKEFTTEPSMTPVIKRLSLLLVEDNPINLKLLITVFKKMGHHFETALDGAEAVEVYRKAQGKFDIVFMDIQMPVMNGMEASVEIRKYEKSNGLPSTVIVALTALNSFEARQAAMDSGADCFLSKPVSMKKLRGVVEEYSEGSKGD